MATSVTAADPTPAHVTPADVAAAAARLTGVVRRTPVLRMELDDGRPVTLKLEHLQVTGSFKARGAANAVLSLPEDTPGVVTASGGNHGQALAWAAGRRGLPATIVVPTTSPDLKADRIAGWGAEVIRHGDIYDDAAELAHEVEQERGLTYVHAFGQPEIVAGAGTVGLEMLDDAPECDALVVAIGGGGLISGVAVAASAGQVPVVGAEPYGAPTLHAAVAAGGVPVEVDVTSITADSLGARITTPLNASLVADHVERIVQLDDDAILAAQTWLWDRARIAGELGACTGMAAVLAGLVDAAHPCVLVCGANEPWQSTARR